MEDIGLEDAMRDLYRTLNEKQRSACNYFDDAVEKLIEETVSELNRILSFTLLKILNEERRKENAAYTDRQP